MQTLDFLHRLLNVYRGVRPFDVARAVYGYDASENYLDDKADHIRRDFLGWACTLDSVRQQRLADLIDERGA